MRKKSFLGILVVFVLGLTGCASMPKLEETSLEFRPVLGKWVRADNSNYVLVIKKVEQNGNMNAVYHNRGRDISRVYVDEAKAEIDGSTIKLFVKLVDLPHYPGSYYSLIYDKKNDRLTGRYFHALSGNFMRVMFEKSGKPSKASSLIQPTPLPETLNIVPPGSDVPAEIAAFSGIWEGIWNNGRSATIAIEEINPPEVIAIYSWGFMNWRHGEAGWARYMARVEKNSIIIERDARRKITATLLENGEMRAVYKKRSEILIGIFKKKIQYEKSEVRTTENSISYVSKREFQPNCL